MNRLVKIREECLPENEKNKGGKQEKKDPFTAAKDKISGELRDVRAMIKVPPPFLLPLIFFPPHLS